MQRNASIIKYQDVNECDENVCLALLMRTNLKIPKKHKSRTYAWSVIRKLIRPAKQNYQALAKQSNIWQLVFIIRLKHIEK